jgi:hypothetical protein
VTDDIKAYCKARNKAVMDGPDALMRFAEQQGKSFPNREIAEITWHKMRTALPHLPEKIRSASKNWLSKRGYHSLD